MYTHISALLTIFKTILSISIFFVWVVRYKNITEEFKGYNYPYWFRDFTGILMLSFSVMIMKNETELIILGCLGIIIQMLGALWTHYMVQNPLRKTIPAFAVLGLCLFIIYFTIYIRLIPWMVTQPLLQLRGGRVVKHRPHHLPRSLRGTSDKQQRQTSGRRIHSPSEKEKNNKLKAIVTAGPTNEYIDPVRFITNKSSGKQGYEIAKSLSNKGFDTTLISGPTNLEIEDVNLIKVETAEEMFQSTLNSLPADVAIFSAAVGDYKVKNISKEKIKKVSNLNLELEKNVDILNYISNHNSLRPKLVIGFAAETNNLEKYANKKLNEKNCDWIIANDVSNKKIGFNSDFNEVSIFYKNNKIERLKYKPKSEISDELVDRIINHLN
mgnify:CR=1 FL=1